MQTVAVLVEAWLADGKQRWSRSYHANTTDLARLAILPTVGGMACEDVRRRHLQLALDTASTPGERGRYRIAVSSMVAYGIEQSWLTMSRDALVPPREYGTRGLRSCTSSLSTSRACRTCCGWRGRW